MSTSWAFHLGTDFLVYIIPFFILNKLRGLTPEQKKSAYVMFGAGLFNIVTAVITVVNYAIPRAIKSHDLDGLNGFDDVTVFFCVLQISTAVMIVCLPQVRRLWLGLSAEALRPELKGLAAAIADVERGSGGNSTPPETKVAAETALRSYDAATEKGSFSVEACQAVNPELRESTTTIGTETTEQRK